MGLGMIEAARFTPPTFAEGFENWSSGDGVAGDPGYEVSRDASLVPGDSIFDTCLEVRKTIEVQKLRSFTQTPILKETYLRIKCRVKMVSGHFQEVRNYGAASDGETPNYKAFTAADDAAAERRLLVPEGQFYIEKGLTLRLKLLFRVTAKLPVSAPFVLQKNFDFTTYIYAFGVEELAFKKAFQALLNSGDHDALDLGGRTIGVNAPIDLQEAVSTRQGYALRRVIRNGALYARRNTAW
ncbi:hypothetical protein N9363_05055 [Paracoccaceae bacterium]|nr:hypothetical protein [Paracoccaceae bacterium]